MTKVVFVGGGVVGLCGAMLLARDGHDVTVIERDPAPPPEVPLDAWTGWQRRGVNQFRRLHYFLPSFRQSIETELPDLVPALEDAGALRFNPLHAMPESMTGGAREGDDRFGTLTGRRPVVEAAVAAVASTVPGLTVRRGVAVTGVLLDGDRDVPDVRGVVLDGGETVAADLVIDAGGRRSPIPGLLEAAGASAPIEQGHDIGFVYYARHFRSGDGTVPVPFGPLLQACGSISTITLPADNGCWGVGIVASARDTAVRAVRDPDVWERVVRSFPLVAHWLDGECLSDGVEIMAKIEDRYRRFCIDGRPVAAGVLPLGDAFACTNPSLGRGASIGLRHAIELRDLLRDADPQDRYALSCRWDDITETTVGPHVRDTMAFDQHRLNEIDAEVAGLPYETDDPVYHLGRALQFSAPKDPDLLRGYLEVVSAHSRGVDVLSRPAIAERAVSLAEGLEGPLPYVGPDRRELLSLLHASHTGV